MTFQYNFIAPLKVSPHCFYYNSIHPQICHKITNLNIKSVVSLKTNTNPFSNIYCISRINGALKFDVYRGVKNNCISSCNYISMYLLIYKRRRNILRCYFCVQYIIMHSSIINNSPLFRFIDNQLGYRSMIKQFLSMLQFRSSR